MSFCDNTSEERNDWCNAGADEIIFSIAPIHTHTVGGNRVKLTGIVPHKKVPDIDGVVLSESGEIPARWSVDGDSLDNDERLQLHAEASRTLRQIAYFGDVLCPG